MPALFPRISRQQVQPDEPSLQAPRQPRTARRLQRRGLGPGLLALATALTLSLLGGCTHKEEPWHLTNVTGHLPDLDFSLTGDDGKPITGDAFKGDTSLVYFGYTHCPDVCPETMARLMQVLAALGPDAHQVRILFITVDPARDTPQALHDYVDLRLTYDHTTEERDHRHEDVAGDLPAAVPGRGPAGRPVLGDVFLLDGQRHLCV